MLRKQYKNPPLVEIACDFQFDPLSEWNSSIPDRLYTKLREKYPQKKDFKGVSFSPMPLPNASETQLVLQSRERVQFLSEDSSAVVQIGPHTLTINQHKPYPGWPAYLQRVQVALEGYRAVASPKGINRIGLRYIDQIDFDSDFTLEDHFDFYPYLGSRLPQTMVHVSLLVHLPFSEGRDVLRMRFQDLPRSGHEGVSISLDYEYFTAYPGVVSFDEAGEWLTQAHDRLVDAFEGSIKDTLRHRFEELSQ